MATITYNDGMNLQLRVRDTGLLEGYTIYFNGQLVDEVGTQDMQPYALDKPDGTMAIVVVFNDEDGGVSGIFDMANGGKRLDRQTGGRHSYLIVTSDAMTKAKTFQGESLKVLAKSLIDSADAKRKSLNALFDK